MIFIGKFLLSRAGMSTCMQKNPCCSITPAKNRFSPLYKVRSLPSASLCIILADSLAYKILSWENYYQWIICSSYL